MGLLDSTLNIGADAMTATMGWAGIATGDPGGAGTANNSTAARVAVPWTAAAGGDSQNSSDMNFTGGAAGGPALYITLWSASSGGTYRGYKLTTGDTSFNAAGEVTVKAGQLTLAGSSTA